jgi:thiol-disulfide isomerase/thioredoxin
MLAGLGLVVSGIAGWALLSDAQARYASRPTDFTAIPAKVSFRAPALTLESLDGGQHSLADYAGQVALVNLWATWCPPCEAEMPVFQLFHEKHRSEGFTIIAVNDGESEADVRAFVAEYGLTFPVWLDPTYEATDRVFKAPNLPTSYVIDRGGTVRLMWIGAISEANLEKYVTSLIKE